MKKSSYEGHVVKCPHCDKDVLDHMTECPFCHGELEPLGYKPIDPAKLKKVKLIGNIVGWSIAAVLIVWLILTKFVFK